MGSGSINGDSIVASFFGQYLINHIQESFSAVAVRERQPLKHDQRVKMLRKHWVANIGSTTPGAILS
jgi:hypothetical protein